LLKSEGITGMIIAGLLSNGCVRAACMSAIDHGYDAILLSDAHSTFYKEAAKRIRLINREMEEAGVHMMETNELYTLL
jgi:nicotinamidase-related amidase